jgi:hypothetical protein
LKQEYNLEGHMLMIQQSLKEQLNNLQRLIQMLDDDQINDAEQ